ncbi:MAG: hypothetical protein R3208_09085 [Ketobacteraceae bacterium]|nr:hypothetical protein [Ketobacteraceae bacterium]
MKKAWLIPLTVLALSVVGCKSVKETEPTWRHHLNEADRPSSRIITSHAEGAFHYLYRDGDNMRFETYDAAGIVIDDGGLGHRSEAPNQFDPETGDGYKTVITGTGLKLIKYNPDFSKAWEASLPDLAMLEGDYTPLSYGFGRNGSMVALLINRMLVTFSGNGGLLGQRLLEVSGGGSASLLGVNRNNELVVSAAGIKVYNQALETLLSVDGITGYRPDVAVVTDEYFILHQNYGFNSYSLVNGDLVWSTGPIGYIYDRVIGDGIYIVHQNPDNDQHLRISRFTLDGNKIWSKGLPGIYDLEPEIQISGDKVMVTYFERVSALPTFTGTGNTKDTDAWRAKLFDASGKEIQSVVMDPMTTVYDCGAFGCSGDIVEGGTESLRDAIIGDDHIFVLSEFDSAVNGKGNHAELSGSHHDLSGYQRSSE